MTKGVPYHPGARTTPEKDNPMKTLLPNPGDLLPIFRIDVRFSDEPGKPAEPLGFLLLRDDGSIHASWSGHDDDLLYRLSDEGPDYIDRWRCQADLDAAGILPGRMTDANLEQLLDHIIAVRDMACDH
jgi:hypothetical protein